MFHVGLETQTPFRLVFAPITPRAPSSHTLILPLVTADRSSRPHRQKQVADRRPQEKTLILFVIRDHVGSTPMSNLTNTLRQDMEKIWASLSKPSHLADATLDSYFDLSFAALPHKVLMPEKFEEAVLELRKRFTDRSREDYVFQPAYHKRIPADGVGFYMEGIWVSWAQSLARPKLTAATSIDEQRSGSADSARAPGTIPV